MLVWPKVSHTSAVSWGREEDSRLFNAQSVKSSAMMLLSLMMSIQTLKSYQQGEKDGFQWSMLQDQHGHTPRTPAASVWSITCGSSIRHRWDQRGLSTAAAARWEEVSFWRQLETNGHGCGKTWDWMHSAAVQALFTLRRLRDPGAGYI